MSYKLTAMTWELKLPMNEKLVMLAIADHANDEDFMCWPTMAHLANKCGVTSRTIQTVIEKLEKKGHIKRQRDRKPDGHFGLTRYTVTIQPPENLSADQRKTTTSTTGKSFRSEPVKLQPINKNQEPPENLSAGCPAGVDPDLYRDYLEVRRSLKCKDSERALTILNNRIIAIRDAGHNPNHAIEEAIVNNWKSVYPPKGQPKSSGNRQYARFE